MGPGSWGPCFLSLSVPRASISSAFLGGFPWPSWLRLECSDWLLSLPLKWEPGWAEPWCAVCWGTGSLLSQAALSGPDKGLHMWFLLHARQASLGIWTWAMGWLVCWRPELLLSEAAGTWDRFFCWPLVEQLCRLPSALIREMCWGGAGS